MKFPKKLTSFTLAVAMVLSNIGSVYATDVSTAVSEKEAETYTVTISETDNGTITFTDSEETVEDFKAGDTVEVGMTPDEGYMVQYFQITSDDTGKVLANVETTDDTFSFTMPKKNVTVSGSFVEGDYKVPESDSTTHYISLNLDEDIIEEVADQSQELLDNAEADDIELGDVQTIGDCNEDGLTQTAHFLTLNYTILDKAYVTSKTTIENMWDDGGDTVYANYSEKVPIYSIKDNEDVFVAFMNIGEMNNTGDYVDAAFVTDSDEDPVDLEGIVTFDEESGVLYIPKSFYYDEEGNELDINIRSQLAVARDLSDATNDVRVTIENNSSIVKAVAEDEIVKCDSYNVTTTFPLLTSDTVSNFDINKVHLYINDSEAELEWLTDNWAIDENGYFTFAYSPLMIYSIKVVIDDSSFTEAFKSVYMEKANAAAITVSSSTAGKMASLQGVELPLEVDGELEAGQVYEFESDTMYYYGTEVIPSNSSIGISAFFGDGSYAGHDDDPTAGFADPNYVSTLYYTTGKNGTGTSALYLPSSTQTYYTGLYNGVSTNTLLGYSINQTAVQSGSTAQVNFYIQPPTGSITSTDGTTTVDWGTKNDWIGTRYDYLDSSGHKMLYMRTRPDYSGGGYLIYGKSSSNGGTGTYTYNGETKTETDFARWSDHAAALPALCAHVTQSLSSSTNGTRTHKLRILYVGTDYIVFAIWGEYTIGTQTPMAIYKVNTTTTTEGCVIAKRTSTASVLRVNKDGEVSSTTKLNKVCNGERYDITSGTTFSIWTNEGCSTAATLYTDGTFGTAITGTHANYVSTRSGSNRTGTIYLKSGTYYVKEEAAPKGYKKASNVVSITVDNAKSQVFKFYDRPDGDPFRLTITKTGSGDTPLANAQFTVNYYKNGVSDSATPKTMVFKTGSDGKMIMDLDHLVSGTLYFIDNGTSGEYDSSDSILFPAGTYVITESTPPAGYLNKGTYSINGGTASSFSTFKLTITESFTSDGSGGWNTVQKASGVTATGSTITVNITNDTINANVTDYEKRGGLAIQKVDSDTNTNVSQSGGNMTATFGIKNTGSKAVYLDTNGDMVGDTKLDAGKTYNVTTGTDGRFYSNPTFLPIGTYEVSEVTPPVGYSGTTFTETVNVTAHGQYHIICDDNSYATMQTYVQTSGKYATNKSSSESDLPTQITNHINSTGATIAFVQHKKNFTNEVIRVKLKIQKTDRDLKDLQGDTTQYDSTKPQGDASFYQATFNLYYVGASGSYIMVDKDGNSSNGNETKVTATTKTELAASGIAYTFTTDANGKAETPSEYLPYGSYYLKEITPSAGYLNGNTRSGVVARDITITAANSPNNVATFEYSYTDQTKAIYEPVIRGTYKLKKNVNKQTTVYSDTLKSYAAKLAEGDTSLKGFTFSIYNISDNYVIIDGKRYETNKTAVETKLGKKTSELTYTDDGIAKVNIKASDVSDLTACYTLTTDSDGYAQTSDNALPYGTYLVVETGTGTGYNAASDDILSHVIRIREESTTITDDYDSTSSLSKGYYNSTWLGGVKIKKNTSNRMDYKDSEGDYPAKKAEGDATLEGAVYEIYNISDSYVWVDKNGDKTYSDSEIFYSNKTSVDAKLTTKIANLTWENDVAKDSVNITWDDVKDLTSCYELKTDKDGYAQTASEVLPYGTYLVVEKTPSTGYLNSTRENGVVSSIFRVRSDKEMVDITYKLADPVIRGGYKLKKNDADEKTHKDGDTYTATKPQGDAKLSGFTYEIYNISASYVWVDKNGNDTYDDSEYFPSVKTTVEGIIGKKVTGLSYTDDHAAETLNITYDDVKNLTSCYTITTGNDGNGNKITSYEHYAPIDDVYNEDGTRKTSDEVKWTETLAKMDAEYKTLDYVICGDDTFS